VADDRFVPLGTFLRAAPDAVPAPQPAVSAMPAPEPVEARDAADEDPERDAAEALADLRRFRAGVADAFDFALADLLRDLAADVLARELLLAPADVTALARAALARHAQEVPVAVRAHPEEAAVLRGDGLPAIADAAMRRGDLLLQVRSGTIDLTLGARLDAVLRKR
jgi:flagellar biosynthesis/type III secretory pathway protein FliH